MKESVTEYPFYDISGPIAIAHRGGDAAGAEKENSMAAFQSAADAGIIYAETDTIATKDGVALAFHGSRNEKAVAETGLPLRSKIQEMTHNEVKNEIRIGYEIIPTLEEVLATFPETRFFIDPKTEEAVAPTAKIIEKLQAQDRVSIGAFRYKRAKDTAELLGGRKDVCTALAAMGSLAMLGLGNRVTAPFVKPYFNRTKATSLQVPQNIVNPNMIERAHDLGIHVIVWPLKPERDDNRAYMDQALEQGVHGLMSDHTHDMVDAVLARDPNNQSIRRPDI